MRLFTAFEADPCKQPRRVVLTATAACALVLAASSARAQTEQAKPPAAGRAAAAQKPAAAKPAAGQPATARPAAGQSPGSAPPAAPAVLQRFDIDEFDVQGADSLPQIEVEEAIYNYLGPNRTSDDVEKARAALEKAYQDKGLQTVSVSVPPQNVERRVVILKVAEAKVGRLNVKGSRYFDQERIKRGAPSLREGQVPDFDDVTKEVTSLNQWPDRRVTPALRAGVKPGTVDVDLNVEDTFPLHASVELNNRQTPNTKPLRLSVTGRYENLWQLGHSLTLNATIAPQRLDDARSFSASYLWRLPENDRLSFLFSALKSDSDKTIPLGGTISGSSTVVGPTAQIGGRAVVTLPSTEKFFHTFNAGMDYRESDSRVTVTVGGETFDPTASPIYYFPLAAAYNATYQGENGVTQLNTDLTVGLRGLGSNVDQYANARFGARGNFVVVKGDLSHTQELPKGFQLFGKAQGQLSDHPLTSSEQFGLGGLDSVRGYLESEAVGDNGVAVTIEARTPNLATFLPVAEAKEGAAPPKLRPLNELRFLAFVDAGWANLREPLAEQARTFEPWSIGVGANFKSFEYLNGSVVLALPMADQDFESERGDPRVLFRFWGEF